MSKSYYHCRQCNKRMVKFSEDDDRERLFYVCRDCGYRCTILTRINGLSEDWPAKIFQQAVSRGVLKKRKGGYSLHL